MMMKRACAWAEVIRCVRACVHAAKHGKVMGKEGHGHPTSVLRALPYAGHCSVGVSASARYYVMLCYWLSGVFGRIRGVRYEACARRRC